MSTRWNSTFDHLATFIELEPYVDKFTGIRDHNLRDFELTREEWGCVKQLVKVLQAWIQLISCIFEADFMQILKEGTEFFSISTPPVSSVIPAMDTIDRAFTTASMGDDFFSLPIKVALELGKRILNKYYNLTDESEIYRASIGEFSILTARFCLTFL